MALHSVIRSVAFGFGFMLAVSAVAQPPNNPGGNGTPPCWPPPCVPIDGGVSFLILAGAAYGGKKAYDYRKNKSEQA